MVLTVVLGVHVEDLPLQGEQLGKYHNPKCNVHKDACHAPVHLVIWVVVTQLPALLSAKQLHSEHPVSDGPTKQRDLEQEDGRQMLP